MGADAAELVHGRMTAQNRPVAHFHLAGQRNPVDQHAVVAHHAVVSDMHVCHHERIASHDGHAFGRRTAVDGGTLPDRRSVSHHGRRILAPELEILRQTGHHGGGVHLAIFPDARSVEHHRAGTDPTAVSDFDIGRNAGERFDRYVLTQFGTLGDIG